ncbi:YolD-like family protein [Paenibacillus taiwanensis]|uniref:YolD-like family protein n=1 Tax=Paenibacillus taiwanensis TaxID=401638 RepID=UPI0004155B5E|nr:YolD-like family protein [Paenibacillus taiwanensis]
MAKAKVPKRPTRDEFVLEELGNQITEAYQEESIVVLTVWGWDEGVKGQIVQLDSRTSKVHVNQDGATIKVPFMDIMRLDYPRD